MGDDFTVPLCCRTHHKDLHKHGNEANSWANSDAFPACKKLWKGGYAHDGSKWSDVNYSRQSSSRAPIVVLDADDVILAKITSGLDLDQLQHDLAGIFEPVHCAHRNIDRLIFVDGLDHPVDRDPRRAAHHDPVLRAVVMFLQ